MRLREALDSSDWSVMCRRIDERVSAAISRYVRDTELDGFDVAEGHAELARLQQGADPDYEHRAVPVAYAFKYLPRSVTAIIGSFDLVAEYYLPYRVLDIGSGCDATSLALHLLSQSSAFHVTAVEPSESMTRLGNCLDIRNVRVTRVDSSIERLRDGEPDIPLGEFDMVVLSCCFSYNHVQWTKLDWEMFCDRLLRYCGEPSSVMVIEPNHKHDLLRRCEEGFRSLGWDASIHSSDEFPQHLTRNATLARLSAQRAAYADLFPKHARSETVRKFLGDPPYPVETWNPFDSGKVYTLVVRVPFEG